MPRYEFVCENCHKPFELIMTISERAKGEVKCPKCKGSKVLPQLGGFMVQTSKKSRAFAVRKARMSRSGDGPIAFLASQSERREWSALDIDDRPDQTWRAGVPERVGSGLA